MARNKRIIQNTDEKKAEIIAAARMLFLEIGYDATSMSKLAATAKITVDRTKYDIKFRSTNFFENLGDKAISNDFVQMGKMVGRMVHNRQKGKIASTSSLIVRGSL